MRCCHRLGNLKDLSSTFETLIYLRIHQVIPFFNCFIFKIVSFLVIEINIQTRKSTNIKRTIFSRVVSV